MTNGRCASDLVFPRVLELTPRELELAELLKYKPREILSALGRYTIYSAFRGNFAVTQTYSASHHGIDYGLPNLTALYCPFPTGEVTFAGYTYDGYAWNIRIVDMTQGLMSVFAHMPTVNPFTVSVGQTVTYAQIIGYSDNTGNSTGPHLHWEIRFPSYTYSSAWNFLSEIDAIPSTPVPVPPPNVTLPVIPTLPGARLTAVVKSWINVRSLPKAGSADLGDLFPGQVVEVFGFEIDSYGNVWYAIKKDKLVGWAAAYYFGAKWLELV